MIVDYFRRYVEAEVPDKVIIHGIELDEDMAFPEEFGDAWKYAGADVSDLYDVTNYENDDYLISYLDQKSFDKEVLIVVDMYIDSQDQVTIVAYLDGDPVSSIECKYTNLVEGVNNMAKEIEKFVKVYKED